MKITIRNTLLVTAVCAAALSFGAPISSAASKSPASGTARKSAASAKFTDADVKALINVKDCGPFFKLSGNVIYYQREISGKASNGNLTGTIDKHKLYTISVNSKTVFILLKTHNMGTKLDPAVLGSIADLKKGCSVSAEMSNKKGNPVASKVLIMTY